MCGPEAEVWTVQVRQADRARMEKQKNRDNLYRQLRLSSTGLAGTRARRGICFILFFLVFFVCFLFYFRVMVSGEIYIWVGQRGASETKENNETKGTEVGRGRQG